MTLFFGGNVKTIIMSIDPGKYNFAYCFLTTTGDILKTGILSHRMTDLKNVKEVNKEVDGFIQEVKDIIQHNKIRLVFERFVPRGKCYQGNLVEITCIKIGMLISILKMYSTCYVIPILAATWKNFYNKHDLWIKNDSLPEHISDAISIGYFYLLKNDKISIPYVKRLVKAHNKHNFGWYMYKNDWFYGKRKIEHLRGKRNSFGN